MTTYSSSKSVRRTPQAVAVTALIFETFRLHGRLIALGDRMVAPFGLTSARWQVLGSIGEAEHDMTVPMIGRNLGLSRQAVQRVINDLRHRGFVEYDDNPHHRRAKLVRMTEAGERAYLAADNAFFSWANSNVQPFDTKNVAASRETVRGLVEICEAYLASTGPE